MTDIKKEAKETIIRINELMEEFTEKTGLIIQIRQDLKRGKDSDDLEDSFLSMVEGSFLSGEELLLKR